MLRKCTVESNENGKEVEKQENGVSVTESVSNMCSKVRTTASAVREKIDDTVDARNTINKIDRLKEIADGVMEAKEMAEDKINQATKIVTTAIETVAGAISTVSNTMDDITHTIDYVERTADGVVDDLKSEFDSIVSDIEDIKNYVPNLIKATKEKIVMATDSLTGSVKQIQLSAEELRDTIVKSPDEFAEVWSHFIGLPTECAESWNETFGDGETSSNNSNNSNSSNNSNNSTSNNNNSNNNNSSNSSTTNNNANNSSNSNNTNNTNNNNNNASSTANETVTTTKRNNIQGLSSVAFVKNILLQLGMSTEKVNKIKYQSDVLSVGYEILFTDDCRYLLPCDIICWTPIKRNSGIGHLGLYVGEGNVVHAPAVGKNIKIDKIWNTKRQSVYKVIRPTAN